MDPEYDSPWCIGPNAYGPSSVASDTERLTALFQIIKPAMDAFASANQGGTLQNLNQLKPFISTPDQQAAFDVLRRENVSFSKP